MKKNKNRLSSGDSSLSVEALEAELKRVKFRSRYGKLLRSTIYALIVTAAVAALIATLILPVLQIYGTSMTPTLTEGDIVVSVKKNNFKRGDIICFYYSNRILVKRVIGLPFDTVSIDEFGNIYLNDSTEPLDEPYIDVKALGECDQEFPIQVPEGAYFVVGDHRETSVDSRSSTIGCISQDEIVGKIIYTVWPLKHFGVVE